MFRTLTVIVVMIFIAQAIAIIGESHRSPQNQTGSVDPISAHFNMGKLWDQQ